MPYLPPPPPPHVQRVLIPTVFVAFAGLFFASANQKTIVSTPVAPPTYNYSPPSTSASRSSGVVLALFKPIYNAGFQYREADEHQKFMLAFEKDFEELLVAKGFSLRGPYDSFDAITYSDKTESHLLVTPQITLVIDQSRVQRETGTKYKYPNGNVPTSRCFGEFVLRCEMLIEARESLSRELLWTKRVPLSEEVVPFDQVEASEGFNVYNNMDCYRQTIAAIAEPRNRGLSELYTASLNRCWDLIDPKELDDLLPQIQAIRDKKVH